MGFYENGIEGLIIEKDGQIEYKEEFELTLEKTEELLDKIIPLENRKFIILSSYFCSVDMSGGKIQKEMDKDKLIEELKRKIYVIEEKNINERLLRKYVIKKLVLRVCNNIEIPDFIEDLELDSCKIERIPNSVKSLKLQYCKDIILPEFLEKLDTNIFIEKFPSTLKELKIKINQQIPLNNLPNIRKLDLQTTCIQQLDFLPNTLEEFIFETFYYEQKLNNLPNSLKKIYLNCVKEVVIPESVCDVFIRGTYKVIIPLGVKKLHLYGSMEMEIIFLDDEYNFEEVDIGCVNHTKIINLPKNLHIDKTEQFGNIYQKITLKE